MEHRLRADREEGGLGVGVGEPLDHLVERGVGEDVGVVGEEHLVVGEQMAHAAQALTDRGLEPGVDEVDRPVGDVRPAELDLALPEHEVVRLGLAVVEEVVLDVVGAVPQAQDELLVPEVRVVPHHVPDQGARTDHLHGLGDVGVPVAHAHAESAAEQDDLHSDSFDASGAGPVTARRWPPSIPR